MAMNPKLKLVEEDEVVEGPPPSPRTAAANTWASLPRPVNDAEVALKIHRSPSLYNALSIAELVALKALCYDNWDGDLIVQAPGPEERVFHARAENSDEPHFFYMFDYMVTLGIKFPFSDFICKCLTIAQVAPCQLQPNAWGFLRCFELLAAYFNFEPTHSLFFAIHTVTFSSLMHSFVAFGARKSMSLFTAYRSNWKVDKFWFFKVIDSPGFIPLMKYTDGTARFPFYWAQSPRHYVGYEDGALTEKEKVVLDFLYEAIEGPISGKELIIAGCNGDANKYLSKSLKMSNMKFVLNSD